MFRITSCLLALLSFLTNRLESQALTPAQLKFLDKNAIPLKADSSYSQAKWHHLSKQLKGKRLLLFGEFTHGSSEIFKLRNDCIRYLHEKKGFNVVLFEAGTGEMILPDLQRKELTPEQMTYGFFGNWRTSEFRELMAYIQSNRIAIAGFDVQRTGGGFKKLLVEVAAQNHLDPEWAGKLEERFGILQNSLTDRKTTYEDVKPDTDALIADYQKILGQLAISQPAGKTLSFAKRTIENRIAFLDYMLQFVRDKNWHKRWAARDSVMAANLIWLVDNFFAGEKIIVAAHNFHISRSNNVEHVMGEFLREKYADSMYSLGVFGGGGAFANNSGARMEMVPADTARLDIKHFAAALDGTVHFLDIPEKRCPGDEWLYEDIVVNDTFIDLKGTRQLTLAEHFDGILILDRVSPPVE